MMKLKLINDETELKLISAKDLDFEDVFKAYNLVMHRNDDLSVTSNDSEADVDVSDKTASCSKPVNHFQTFGDVKVDIECPKCGFVGIQKTRMGFRFIKCPSCFTKLFLAPANGDWGVKDDKGMTYKANDIFRDRYSNDNNEFEDMYKHSDSLDVPDTYSTIPEIEKYLDDNGINHVGIHLKGQLLDKMKEIKHD